MSDYFHPEVLTEILSKLPVKSLLKFRCVCKSWCSLITSPDFINNHLNQAKINTHARKQLLIRYMSPNSQNEQYSLRLDDDSFESYDEFECPIEAMVYFRIVGVCNGLICLSDDMFTYTYTLIIWNPAIHRYLSLPKPSINFDSSGSYKFALGFGFDSLRNDYKVVRLAYLRSDEPGDVFCATPQVEIYALGTCCWRTIKSGVPPVSIVDFVWTQTFLNGSVHWVAYKKEDDDCCLRNVILSFDMAEEKFGVLEFPQALANDFPLKFTVGLHRESLALFAYDNRVDCNSFEVYAMSEYGVAESWSKIYKIVDVEGGIGTVLGFRGQNGRMLLTTKANELVSYEPDCNRAKKLGIRGVKESVYAGAYAESLVLLKEGVNSRLEGRVKSYVASIGAANRKETVDERYVKDEIDLGYMYATDSIPGFKIPDSVWMSSTLGMKAFMYTMSRLFPR